MNFASWNPAAGWQTCCVTRSSLAPAPRQPGNLAVTVGDLPGVDQAANWLGQLEALFERMGDSLDEY